MKLDTFKEMIKEFIRSASALILMIIIILTILPLKPAINSAITEWIYLDNVYLLMALGGVFFASIIKDIRIQNIKHFLYIIFWESEEFVKFVFSLCLIIFSANYFITNDNYISDLFDKEYISDSSFEVKVEHYQSKLELRYNKKLEEREKREVLKEQLEQQEILEEKERKEKQAWEDGREERIEQELIALKEEIRALKEQGAK